MAMATLDRPNRRKVRVIRTTTKQRAEPAILGCTVPRLFTRPLVTGEPGRCGCGCALTPKTSLGFSIVRFAKTIGEPLNPWQRWVAIHAMELKPDGSLRFRTILVIVARQNGKSHLKRIISLYRLYRMGSRLVLGIAQDETQALAQMELAMETIDNCDNLRNQFFRHSRDSGNKYFQLDNGAKYRVRASNRRAGRGFTVDELNIDELREQYDYDVWSAVSKTTSAVPNGQNWLMSNAGDDRSVVLWRLREVALSGSDPATFIAEYSAEEGCALDDIEAIRQSNPALNYPNGPRLETILSDAVNDPPGVFRTEVLCQRVSGLQTAIDPEAWKECADKNLPPIDPTSRVALCLDVATDGEHATLAIATLTDSGKPRVDVVKGWDSTDGVRNDLPGLLEAIKPAAVAWYPSGPAAAVAAILRPQDLETRDGRKFKGQTEYVELMGLKAAEACMGLEELVTSRKLVHPDNGLLNVQLAHARKLNSGDGWRFVRMGEATPHCDAAYAIAGAVKIVQNLPAQTRPPGMTFL